MCIFTGKQTLSQVYIYIYSMYTYNSIYIIFRDTTETSSASLSVLPGLGQVLQVERCCMWTAVRVSFYQGGLPMGKLWNNRQPRSRLLRPAIPVGGRERGMEVMRPQAQCQAAFQANLCQPAFKANLCQPAFRANLCQLSWAPRDSAVHPATVHPLLRPHPRTYWKTLGFVIYYIYIVGILRYIY